MAPKYKLIYFDARGRMETTRLAFELSGIPYEDFRIDNEQWPELKASELRNSMSAPRDIARAGQCEIHRPFCDSETI